MPHALIIDDNPAASGWIKTELISLGFDSFDHAWTERDALDAARAREPDLVVVGHAAEQGMAFEAARQIAARWSDVVMLYMTARRSGLSDLLPQGARLEGPFGPESLPQAIGRAGDGTGLRAV